MKNIKNIFLDRDGTIIVDKHYLHDPAGVELISRVGESLQQLARAGMKLFVVTNQSGIGRGYFTRTDFQACQDKMTELLLPHGVHFSGQALCPHAPDTKCACRKPDTGMWNELSHEHGLRAKESVIIGDKRADVSFGLNAGFVCSILVLTGHGVEEAQKLELPDLPTTRTPVLEIQQRKNNWPHLVATDLAAACDWLIARAG